MAKIPRPHIISQIFQIKSSNLKKITIFPVITSNRSYQLYIISNIWISCRIFVGILQHGSCIVPTILTISSNYHIISHHIISYHISKKNTYIINIVSYIKYIILIIYHMYISYIILIILIISIIYHINHKSNIIYHISS